MCPTADLSGDAASGSKPLRHGYTTAACAAAAATAAVRALLTGEPVASVTIDLPGEKQVVFAMKRCEIAEGRVLCGTIKDAGDDPDVTHGAEIQATVQWRDAPGVVIEGGAGVGQVTQPGLAVPVGEAAINPGARRLISHAVAAEAGLRLPPDKGLRVIVSVPGGEALAQKTMNPRLGILGGISILGASGIVEPYSHQAYLASINVALKVARANGLAGIAITTGKRSEEYLRQHYPAWPEMAFVQVGDHVGYAVAHAYRAGFEELVLATMIGKASKLAQGRLQTHVAEGSVDLAFLARIARELGADAGVQTAICAANTAHHVQVILRAAGVTGLEARLAQLVAEQLWLHAGGDLRISVYLHALDGATLGMAHKERSS
jgi:cobalt-precorrin-5B (C1)-methyltransferase